MSDAAPAAAAAPAKAVKAKKPAKPKAAPTHPKTTVMVAAAIAALKEKKGSSRAAIKEYITDNYKVDTRKLARHLKKALKTGVEMKTFVKVKGFFKLGKVEIVKCVICDIHFKHQDSFKQHMRSFHLEHKKKTHYKCDTCNLQGFTIEGFKRHISSIHGKEIVNVKTFNKSKMDNGPVENSGGAKKPKVEQDEVNSPIKSNSAFLENPSISQTSSKISKLRTKFQCESCDLSYVSNSLLERHIEKFHLGQNLFRMIDPDQFLVDRK